MYDDDCMKNTNKCTSLINVYCWCLCSALWVFVSKLCTLMIIFVITYNISIIIRSLCAAVMCTTQHHTPNNITHLTHLHRVRVKQTDKHRIINVNLLYECVFMLNWDACPLSVSADCQRSHTTSDKHQNNQNWLKTINKSHLPDTHHRSVKQSGWEITLKTATLFKKALNDVTIYRDFLPKINTFTNKVLNIELTLMFIRVYYKIMTVFHRERNSAAMMKCHLTDRVSQNIPSSLHRQLTTYTPPYIKTSLQTHFST